MDGNGRFVEQAVADEAARQATMKAAMDAIRAVAPHSIIVGVNKSPITGATTGAFVMMHTAVNLVDLHVMSSHLQAVATGQVIASMNAKP